MTQVFQNGQIVSEPAAAGRYGEDDHDDRQQILAHDAEALAERREGQCAAVGAVGPCTAQNDSECRDGADDERVKEDLEGTPQPLLDRVNGLCGGVDHGRSAPACLVGVDGTGHTDADHLCDRAACKAADGSGAGESIDKDGSDRRGHAGDVDDDHHDTHDDVQEAHDRNELREGIGNAAGTAARDDVGQDDDKDADKDDAVHGHRPDLHGIQVQRAGYDLGGGQRGGCDKEGGKDTDGKDDAGDHPQLAPVMLFAQALLHVVGRSAVGIAVVLVLTVVKTQGDLDLLEIIYLIKVKKFLN